MDGNQQFELTMA